MLDYDTRSGSAPAGGRRPRFVSSDLNGRSTTWREKVVFTLPQFSTGIMQLFHDYWLGYVGSVPVRQLVCTHRRAHTSSPALHTRRMDPARFMLTKSSSTSGESRWCCPSTRACTCC